MDLASAFQQDINAGPQWVVWWIRFMGLVIFLSVPFAFVRVEARWMVLVALVTVPFMLWLYSIFGYQRILGLGHVIPWTPFVIYLWRRRDHWHVKQTLAGKWLALLFVVMTASLVMDYADVARYIAGERL